MEHQDGLEDALLVLSDLFDLLVLREPGFLEPSLRRLRIPSQNWGKHAYVTPIKGHTGHRRGVMHGLTPFWELLSSLLPYTLTGKELGTEDNFSKRRTLGHPRLKFGLAQPRQATYTGASLVEVNPEVPIVGHSNK
ncbi:hypothetical protein CRG98_030362 [Punica granatum]|uniref:Uncharacterized protein n=1 Tax=Punica granatum TaxID=22663 RepID=A0A2I0IZS0_PUNGR|nr:hypothetical protein CRG98_030362 [Punica granatum]